MRQETADAFGGREVMEDAGETGPLEGARRAGAPTQPADLGGIVRIIACGSVDDGKSTLIGRLLWDASPLYEDQRARLLKETAKLGGGQRPDFSRLLDGLIAEQEQGITIDIAWHYFDTQNRRIVIIDAPGHEQYTRNMATGASHADVGVLLVDAQSGLKRQTRRHLAILHLVGVRHVVLAVNKMDLVGWAKERHAAIVADFGALAAEFDGLEWTAIPLSALSGDNVVTRSAHMSWYEGPTFGEYLNSVPSRQSDDRGPFRMPVQLVLRDGSGFRGVAGTLASGKISVGDAVRDTLSGRQSTVARIDTPKGPARAARCGQSIVLTLTDDLDIARGTILAATDAPTTRAKSLKARLVWLSETALADSHAYLLRTATDLAPVGQIKVHARLDLDRLTWGQAEAVEPNSVVEASLELARSVACDAFADNAATGSFMLLDTLSGAAVAGGIIVAAGEEIYAEADEGAFILSRQMLARGLCADLALDGSDEAEYNRRANEVAILMQAAGLRVKIV